MTGRFARSLRVQLNALALIFLALPFLLYSVFNAADREKRDLVLSAIRENGLLIAQALAPTLQTLSPADFGALPAALARFHADQRSVKLLFKPNGTVGQSGFFYVASSPPTAPEALGAERQLLADLGVLDRLSESCVGNQPLSDSVKTPGGAVEGAREVLTSVSPVRSPAGCWAVVAAIDQRAAFGLIDERAYWMRPESRIALGIYAGVALLAVGIFVSLRANLSKLTRAAQAAEPGESFEQAVAIPELRPMAREFDRMVARLKGAAALLRQSAEDNAHAFKAPIAAIRQSIEPLRAVAVEDTASGRALGAIAASLDRLDGLVRSARRLDAAAAELLESERASIDLSALVEGFAADYQTMIAPKAVKLAAEAAPAIRLPVDGDLVETILENLVENAVSFSAPGGAVTVRLAQEDGAVRLEVLDQGPGVPEDRLSKIFERYYSDRPQSAEPQAHFGVGLSLVAQNAAALGGSVSAANRAGGGLIVTVILPLAG
ncbi:MAG: sensor histidine kinase [Elsteraceae bacterium]